MPILDYKCQSCDHVWEEFRRNQTDPEKCVKCESKNIKRLIGKSNFHLKGKGWYKNGTHKD